MDNLQLLYEDWRYVPHFEGLYLISNRGIVISLSRKKYSKAGNPYYTKQLQLKPRSKKGYLNVMLYSFNHKESTVRVNRLVAMAFIPNPENKPQVNHINGIKHMDVFYNLEWSTAKENIRHAFKTGLHKVVRGEDVYNAKLTENDIVAIRNSIESSSVLAKVYNVNYKHIWAIRNGTRWKHIA